MPRRANTSGKRPKDGKRYPLNMRTTFDVRQRLETEAAASGRSLTQEAEMRIERSFLDQKNSLEALDLTFGRDLAGILHILGEAMKLSGQQAAFLATRTLDGSQNWLENAYAFAQVRNAALSVIDRLKPVGDPTPPQIAEPLVTVSVGSPPPGGWPKLDPACLGVSLADQILDEAASGRTLMVGGDDRALRLHRAAGHIFQRRKNQGSGADK